jgi:hypothetical protein
VGEVLERFLWGVQDTVEVEVQHSIAGHTRDMRKAVKYARRPIRTEPIHWYRIRETLVHISARIAGERAGGSHSEIRVSGHGVRAFCTVSPYEDESCVRPKGKDPLNVLERPSRALDPQPPLKTDGQPIEELREHLGGSAGAEQ